MLTCLYYLPKPAYQSSQSRAANARTRAKALLWSTTGLVYGKAFFSCVQGVRGDVPPETRPKERELLFHTLFYPYGATFFACIPTSLVCQAQGDSHRKLPRRSAAVSAASRLTGTNVRRLVLRVPLRFRSGSVLVLRFVTPLRVVTGQGGVWLALRNWHLLCCPFWTHVPISSSPKAVFSSLLLSFSLGHLLSTYRLLAPSS